MTLYVLCGIPGSGKSTLAQQIAVQCNAKLHCYDSLPNAHTTGKTESVHEQMWGNIVADLVAGNDVVCDDLHTKKQWRQDILDALSDIECKKILVVMDTSLEKCLHRNANRATCLPDFVVCDLYNKYEPPTLDEGWDKIIYVKEDGIYEKHFTGD